MLGFSLSQLIFTLGAISVLLGPKDLPILARTAGRLVGRSIAYVQLARGHFDSIMEQTKYRQVNKELQETMSQLDAIRHEIRSMSFMNQGPMTRTVTDDPDQTAPDAGRSPSHSGPSNLTEEKKGPPQKEHEYRELKAAINLSKEYKSPASGMTDVHSQATAFARLAKLQASVAGKGGVDSSSSVDDKPGLLSVLPVSAENAGLLPKLQGDPTGSDIVLEAVLEAEVARNAKNFFSQPQNEVKAE